MTMFASLTLDAFVNDEMKELWLSAVLFWVRTIIAHHIATVHIVSLAIDAKPVIVSFMF